MEKLLPADVVKKVWRVCVCVLHDDWDHVDLMSAVSSRVKLVR